MKSLCEGCSIRSIGKILKISFTSVLGRIIRIATGVKRTSIAFGKTYELDELSTYIQQKTKQRWIVFHGRI